MTAYINGKKKNHETNESFSEKYGDQLSFYISTM